VVTNRVFVKICGITNLDDAQCATALGADALGFVFARSARQVTAEQVRSILSRLSGEVLTFGVFVDEPVAHVLRQVDSLGLSGVQLHGSETPDEVAYLRERIPYVIKAISVTQDFLEQSARYQHTWAILGDGPVPGSGRPADWSTVAAQRESAMPANDEGISMSRGMSDVPRPARFILAGGLRVDNVAKAIRQVQPFGVDVSSGVERTPGHKDPDRLRAFISAVRGVAATSLPSYGQ
jgi:phosphoribosylanthranilate isomerase